MSPHPLTNFETQKYYKNEPIFNGVFSRNNLFKKKITEITEFIENKNIKAIIFRIQENNLVMYGYICMGFIDFMLAGKKLTDHTNLFSPYDLKKNDSIILSYFKNESK